MLTADDYDEAADTIWRRGLRCCGIRYGSGRGRPLGCRPACFETAAARPPQHEVGFRVPPRLYLILTVTPDKRAPPHSGHLTQIVTPAKRPQGARAGVQGRPFERSPWTLGSGAVGDD